ncbi:MAG: MEDS domain-containing protein [Chloroflexi bacterium]|nr:MEDS domain-containing protein [Chloroflexota bacterium]
MNDPRQEIDLGFTQEIFPDCHHVCLIYDNEGQRRKIVSEYLAAGIKRGDLVRYFADTTAPEEVRAWLLEKGIELDKAEQQGHFAIVKAENAYCPSGQFVPPQVIENMLSRYAMAKQAGYHGSRACGEMTWALHGIPGSDRLLEYEIRINTITETFPYVGMCQYNARLFDGATLFKVLQVHPYMIAQGQIVRNPYYHKPEEFLSKFPENARSIQLRPVRISLRNPDR